MTKERRNPYLVLGLPYGSEIRDVRRAFAKRAKKVAARNMTAYTMEDLTWALFQLEQSQHDPEVDITIYRIPANPETFRFQAEDTPEFGLFWPQAVPIQRRTAPSDREEIEELLDNAIVQWAEYMLDRGSQLVEIPYPFPD